MHGDVARSERPVGQGIDVACAVHPFGGERAGQQQPGDHRQPEAEAAEQQGRGEARCNGHAGKRERSHRSRLEGAEPAGQESDAAHDRSDHETREHGPGAGVDAQRLEQNPNRGCVEQRDQHLQRRRADQQRRVVDEARAALLQQLDESADHGQFLQARGDPSGLLASQRQDCRDQRAAVAKEQHGDRDDQRSRVACPRQERQGDGEIDDVGDVERRRVDRDGRHDRVALHPILDQRACDDCGTARSHGRYGLVDEQLGQAQATRHHEGHGRAGALQHSAPDAGLHHVSSGLQDQGRDQPGGMRVAEQVHDRAFFGRMQRDEDDGGDASGAEQPGKPTH